MFTLVDIRPSATSSREARSLVADYVAFDRQRTVRRQYMKAFGGMAVLVLLGAVFGRVPFNEAWVVIGLLVTPPSVLAAIEMVQRHQLARRLDEVRAEAREPRKS